MKEYYKDNLYLIDDFYTYFKEILKKARITENKNFLMKKIGKENYQQFLQLINKNYLETTEVFPKLEESVQNEIRTLINAMKEHEKSSYEYKKETLEKYYQTLSEEGYTVIPMEVITKGRKR